jgi:hypothetical protein
MSGPTSFTIAASASPPMIIATIPPAIAVR